MMNKLKTFMILPKEMKAVYLEAYIALMKGRLVKTKSNRRILSSFGRPGHETSFNEEVNKETVLKVSHAIHTMADNAWWESECLVKAAAAMTMLERRNLPVTLYLGTGKSGDGTFVAHAWTRCGRYYVTGAERLDNYTVIMTYARDGAGKGENNEPNAEDRNAT